MLKPPAIKPGDTIAIVSPSLPVTADLRNQFDAGVAQLQSMGFRVKLGAHALGQHFYNGATATQRADDFNTCWADPEVSMILMSQGGQTANALLDKLDYELFAREPKIFAGISDGTTLLNAIAGHSNIVTFHGPDLLWIFGRTMTAPFVDHIQTILSNGWSGALPSPTLRTIREGKTTGQLWGGHNNILKEVMFAGYGPKLNDAILFLEGTSPIHELDRQFRAFRLAGVFEQIGGLVLGHFENSQLDDPSMKRSISDMVLEITDGYDFPIVEMQELGHNVENFVFPIGIQTTIDTEANQISFDEPAVSNFLSPTTSAKL